MPAIPIFITMTEERPPEVIKKHWNTIMQHGLMRVIEHWHSEMLPRHFAPGASARYGYKKRSAKWLKRKRALARVGLAAGTGELDLVFRGMLREHVTTMATFQATATRATVSMRGRAFVQLNLKSTRQPDYVREITDTTGDERSALGAMLEEHVATKLIHLKELRTQRAS